MKSPDLAPWSRERSKGERPFPGRPRKAAGVLSSVAGPVFVWPEKLEAHVAAQRSSNDQRPKALDTKPFFLFPFLERNELCEPPKNALQSAPSQAPPASEALLGLGTSRAQLCGVGQGSLSLSGIKARVSVRLEEQPQNHFSTLSTVEFISKQTKTHLETKADGSHSGSTWLREVEPANVAAFGTNGVQAARPPPAGGLSSLSAEADSSQVALCVSSPLQAQSFPVSSRFSWQAHYGPAEVRRGRRHS